MAESVGPCAYAFLLQSEEHTACATCSINLRLRTLEGGEVEGEVRRDGGVLVVPVVGREQVELEVLGTLVGHVLAIDHHVEPEIPLGDVEVVEEAADLGRDG